MQNTILSYQSLEEMHKDIEEKNLCSFFSKIAKRHHKGSPAELGVFYFYQGRVYKESREWNSPEIYKDTPGLRTLDVIHEDAWEKIVEKNPSLKGFSWEDLPRGRVLFKNNKFIVDLDPFLVSLEEIKNKILLEFCLPPEEREEDPDYRLTQFHPDSFYSYNKKIPV